MFLIHFFQKRTDSFEISAKNYHDSGFIRTINFLLEKQNKINEILDDPILKIHAFFKSLVFEIFI